MVKNFTIGDLIIDGGAIAAPLAGITDKVYRRILMDCGAPFCFTEMVCAKALVYRNKKTYTLLDLEKNDPCGVQIFGSDPAEMAFAAEVAVSRGAKLVDINMGCPVPKVVKNNEGSALLKQPDLALSIAEAVVKAVEAPVTVKLRKGFDDDDCLGIKLAKRLPDVGVQGITLHGRSRNQYYSGKADWSAIAEVKNSVSVPVIGNGDVFCGADAVKMVAETGCDGVMIARGALGNPWLMQEANDMLKGMPKSKEISAGERIDMAIRHLTDACAYYGEEQGVPFMRKFFSWYLKGFRGAAAVRGSINKITKIDEAKVLLLSLKGKD